MITVTVPDALVHYNQLCQQTISFVHYQEANPVGRHLLSFKQCAISFVLTGQKELFRHTEKALVRAVEGVIIPHGHALIAERRLEMTCYSSLVAFFPLDMLADFIRRRQPVNYTGSSLNQPASSHFLHFQATPYLLSYITNILSLIEQQATISYALLMHKLQELFLAIFEAYPDELTSLLAHAIQPAELRLRALVENNLANNLSLRELAFLANRSLASFKRDFEKTYGLAPGRYLVQRKMEIASHALYGGADLLQTALAAGYDNLSNFTVAFKKFTGYTPKQYQRLQLLLDSFAL